ncbi:hypothetical protein [Nostoc linckia]|uniref:hypothetical protein n=1 Tax=Nostoc linckia TaxID=92942 RepID=UPI00117C88A7|nr:hypothetical protein [Nostoc linckia]
MGHRASGIRRWGSVGSVGGKRIYISPSSDTTHTSQCPIPYAPCPNSILYEFQVRVKLPV